jgi:hypothetical protein
MVDVLVIVMAVVVVALVVTTRLRKSTVHWSHRTDVLGALVPVVGGSVSADQVLTGRYRGYDIEVLLRTAAPEAPGMTAESFRDMVEAVQLRLIGARGAQPWYVWRSPSLTGRSWDWHFARPDGGDFLPFFGHLSRMAGLPPADADLPDRLRAAGILAAFERVSPPTKDSLPRISFIPDLRSPMMERLRAVRDLPPAAAQPSAQTAPRLELEVERMGDADPSPERFRALLDAAVDVAEINARANPADITST